jgi:spore germination cell wall hydrolase CwlJ-like protein
MNSDLKREWSLWIALFILITASFYTVETQKDVRADLQNRIDSIEAVHERTVHELRDANRLAENNTNGLSDAEQREVLWTTRAVLSETKNPREMLLIANVIRNRIDMRYRGKRTAKEVILDPYQFSAFNPGRDSRWRYANLEQHHISTRLWRAAWQASRYAMTSSRAVLPITDRCVTHFVHPRNLRRNPEWIYHLEQLRLGDVQRPNIALFRQNRAKICQTEASTSEDQTPRR